MRRCATLPISVSSISVTFESVMDKDTILKAFQLPQQTIPISTSFTDPHEIRIRIHVSDTILLLKSLQFLVISY